MILFFVSCGITGQAASSSTTAKKISTYAKDYLNTPYRYGGTSKQGMDCSGLIFQSFLKYGKELPRTTKDLSKYGQKIKLKHTRVGDLLFFKTSKKWGGINHVGLVTKVYGNSIEFIHSTTSKGVIISGLNQYYWAKTFKFARRVL